MDQFLQAAYGNLQLFTAALQLLISDTNDPLSKQKTANNARINESMNAMMEQFSALQGILGGTVRGYASLDSFYCRVFNGGQIDALRTEILGSIEKLRYYFRIAVLGSIMEPQDALIRVHAVDTSQEQ